MQTQMKWIHGIAALMGFAGVCYITACGTAEPRGSDDGPIGEDQEAICLSNVICSGVCCVQPPHTNSPTCSIFLHTCLYGSCSSGWGDCDGNLASNGCETNLNTSVPNCGSCGHNCNSASNVTSSTCIGGSCLILTCTSGTADCNGNAADGCEANANDPAHCGSSCTVCPATAPHTVATCTSGTCGVTCAAGWGDCDNDMSNGCESALNTDAHCGSCSPCTSTSGDVICQQGGSGAYSCVNVPCDGSHPCPSGTQCSNGSCIDILWDPCHCGQTGFTGICASSGHTCCTNGSQAMGATTNSCPMGYTDIGACCANCQPGVSCPSP